MIDGEDVLLKDLILKHSLDDNNLVMENLSCDDLLDFGLKENFDEINSTFK